jgi:hypothetical protein
VSKYNLWSDPVVDNNHFEADCILRVINLDILHSKCRRPVFISIPGGSPPRMLIHIYSLIQHCIGDIEIQYYYSSLKPLSTPLDRPFRPRIAFGHIANSAARPDDSNR